MLWVPAERAKEGIPDVSQWIGGRMPASLDMRMGPISSAPGLVRVLLVAKALLGEQPGLIPNLDVVEWAPGPIVNDMSITFTPNVNPV
jgi:hypothetical protein